MLRKLKPLLLALFGCLFLSGPLPAEQGTLSKVQEGTVFKVIVHPSNNLPSLSKEQVSKMFLKKVTKWQNGRTVFPVDQGETSLVRERFSQKIHEKTVTAIKAYWHQKIFSGRDVPPPEKTTDAEVLEFVRSNVDAIGYIAETSPAGNAKVMKITE